MNVGDAVSLIQRRQAVHVSVLTNVKSVKPLSEQSSQESEGRSLGSSLTLDSGTRRLICLLAADQFLTASELDSIISYLQLRRSFIIANDPDYWELCERVGVTRAREADQCAVSTKENKYDGKFSKTTVSAKSFGGQVLAVSTDTVDKLASTMSARLLCKSNLADSAESLKEPVQTVSAEFLDMPVIDSSFNETLLKSFDKADLTVSTMTVNEPALAVSSKSLSRHVLTDSLDKLHRTVSAKSMDSPDLEVSLNTLALGTSISSKSTGKQVLTSSAKSLDTPDPVVLTNSITAVSEKKFQFTIKALSKAANLDSGSVIFCEGDTEDDAEHLSVPGHSKTTKHFDTSNTNYPTLSLDTVIHNIQTTLSIQSLPSIPSRYTASAAGHMPRKSSNGPFLPKSVLLSDCSNKRPSVCLDDTRTVDSIAISTTHGMSYNLPFASADGAVNCVPAASNTASTGAVFTTVCTPGTPTWSSCAMRSPTNTLNVVNPLANCLVMCGSPSTVATIDTQLLTSAAMSCQGSVSAGNQWQVVKSDNSLMSCTNPSVSLLASAPPGIADQIASLLFTISPMYASQAAPPGSTDHVTSSVFTSSSIMSVASTRGAPPGNKDQLVAAASVKTAGMRVNRSPLSVTTQTNMPAGSKNAVSTSVFTSQSTFSTNSADTPVGDKSLCITSSNTSKVSSSASISNGSTPEGVKNVLRTSANTLTAASIEGATSVGDKNLCVTSGNTLMVASNALIFVGSTKCTTVNNKIVKITSGNTSAICSDPLICAGRTKSATPAGDKNLRITSVSTLSVDSNASSYAVSAKGTPVSDKNVLTTSAYTSKGICAGSTKSATTLGDKNLHISSASTMTVNSSASEATSTAESKNLIMTSTNTVKVCSNISTSALCAPCEVSLCPISVSDKNLPTRSANIPIVCSKITTPTVGSKGTTLAGDKSLGNTPGNSSSVGTNVSLSAVSTKITIKHNKNLCMSSANTLMICSNPSISVMNTHDSTTSSTGNQVTKSILTSQSRPTLNVTSTTPVADKNQPVKSANTATSCSSSSSSLVSGKSTTPVIDKNVRFTATNTSVGCSNTAASVVRTKSTVLVGEKNLHTASATTSMVASNASMSTVNVPDTLVRNKNLPSSSANNSKSTLNSSTCVLSVQEPTPAGSSNLVTKPVCTSQALSAMFTNISTSVGNKSLTLTSANLSVVVSSNLLTSVAVSRKSITPVNDKNLGNTSVKISTVGSNLSNSAFNTAANTSIGDSKASRYATCPRMAAPVCSPNQVKPLMSLSGEYIISIVTVMNVLNNLFRDKCFVF